MGIYNSLPENRKLVRNAREPMHHEYTKKLSLRGQLWLLCEPRARNPLTDIRPLREIEKEAILEAIISTGGVVSAATALKVGKTTIYRKMKKYGIVMKANHILAELRRQKALRFVPNGETK